MHQKPLVGRAVFGPNCGAPQDPIARIGNENPWRQGRERYGGRTGKGREEEKGKGKGRRKGFMPALPFPTSSLGPAGASCVGSNPQKQARRKETKPLKALFHFP